MIPDYLERSKSYKDSVNQINKRAKTNYTAYNKNILR